MKRVLLLFLLAPIIVLGQSNFEKHFKEKSLRIDFELAGNENDEYAILQSMKQEPYWGGNTSILLPKYSLGDYSITMENLQGELLYAKGFNSLFREWQTIGEAQKINRSFYHTIQLPYPKDSVILSIKSRQKDGHFYTLLKWKIDPKSYLINQDKTPNYPVDTISYAGNSSDNLDLVFLAEGYTKKELPKFIKDVKRFKEWIFSVEPFSVYKDKINCFAIPCPSENSGTDVPGDHIYQKTILNSSFYTFNSPRYLTIKDTKKMYDIVAQVPYDHIYVLVNTEIYGGAGFYNTYTSCASDCRNAEEIASHELCHGLIGLADEYYTNSEEINYYYNLNIEPWEPNITTLTDFSKKWKHLVDKKTPIPTPRISKYKQQLGAFEGGAYQSKGIYSPMQDCKMKTNNTTELCPACQEAVHKIIQTYIND